MAPHVNDLATPTATTNASFTGGCDDIAVLLLMLTMPFALQIMQSLLMFWLMMLQMVLSFLKPLIILSLLLYPLLILAVGLKRLYVRLQRKL